MITVEVTGPWYEALAEALATGVTIPGDPPTRLITGAELATFCALVGNFHRLHWDLEYARSKGYRNLVVVGDLVTSLATGTTVSGVSGRGVNLATKATFAGSGLEGPTCVGDTISVQTKVLEARPTSRGDQGVVRVESTVFNLTIAKTVATIERSVLVPLRLPKEKSVRP